MPGGEVVIVHHPYPHASRPGLFDDDVHIAPPAWAKIVGMGPSFDADGANTGVVDAGHLVANDGLPFTALPQEWQQVVGLVAVQHIVKTGWA